MSRGSLCRKRRDVWLRDEVGIRAGQAASSSPAGLWGLGKSGGRPRPQLLCKPTWLLEQGHPPNKRSDLSYKGPQGCTVVLNRRKRITHFSPPPPPPVSQPGHGGGGGVSEVTGNTDQRVWPRCWDTPLHPHAACPWVETPQSRQPLCPFFLWGEGLA